MLNLTQKITAAERILLSTHRQCDGDGLGSEIALYYALKKLKKNVRILNVDATAKKYEFLECEGIIETFEQRTHKVDKVDLVLIFDTNDSRLLEPLYSEFKAQAKDIFFIDHHQVLKVGPQPPDGSFIDTAAASTGEITYALIKGLDIALDQQIARALYTSIVFDTQLFRFVRNSSHSHLIAAELLKYDIQPEDIHLKLFGNYTVQKMKFLAHALNQIEYFCEGKLAVLKLNAKDLAQFGIDNEDSNDVIDFLMNIESLQAAALFREEGPQKFKLSLRSKGNFGVLHIAEDLGGGGHLFSSGAYLNGNYENIKDQVLNSLVHSLSTVKTPATNDQKNESA